MSRRLSLVLVSAALVQFGLLVSGSARAMEVFPSNGGGGDTREAEGVSAGASGARGSTTSAACLATPVQKGGTRVRAGGFVGGIVPDYDVVDGRFRLHVGPYRDKSVPGGLSQKIPWRTSRPGRTGPSLVVVGIRLSPRPTLQFTQTFGSSLRYLFPTTISPPAPGCWRLHLTSGRVTGSVVARVDLLERSR